MSAYEQDDAVLSDTVRYLRSDRALGGVAAGIEALIHFRLKQEWDERRRYSALLEQLQLTASLGESIHFLFHLPRYLLCWILRMHKRTASERD